MRTVLLIAAPLAALASPAGAGDRATEISPKRINAAIDAGVAWLKARQTAEGGWGPCVAHGSYDGASGGGRCHFLGPTAFSIFTLATCGVRRSDECVARGLEWLRERTSTDYRHTSYESAAVVLALTSINDDPRLAKARIRTKNPLTRPRGSRFPRTEWRWLHERVRHLARCRAGSGGFGYWAEGGSYADASATQFALLALRAASRAGYPVERTCEGAWLRAAGYAVERVGMIGERSEIGGRDWYRRGAALLLDAQEENGRWVDTTCMDPEDVLGTCFALLFLKRATPPPATTARED